jgi:methylisocitrate lyase
MSAGSNLRRAVEAEIPLQLVGTINAYCARLAERAGFKAIYLSGAGGADMVFAEALYALEDYRGFTGKVPVPVLANLTEFGKTPLFTLQELREVGVRLALYPLSAFRAMSEIATRVYGTIRSQGTQKDVVDQMQTRAELYNVLNYHSFEDKLDRLFSIDRK